MLKSIDIFENTQTLTLTSLRIAELTGIRHADLLHEIPIILHDIQHKVVNKTKSNIIPQVNGWTSPLVKKPVTTTHSTNQTQSDLLAGETSTKSKPDVKIKYAKDARLANTSAIRANYYDKKNEARPYYILPYATALVIVARIKPTLAIKFITTLHDALQARAQLTLDDSQHKLEQSQLALEQEKKDKHLALSKQQSHYLTKMKETTTRAHRYMKAVDTNTRLSQKCTLRYITYMIETCSYIRNISTREVFMTEFNNFHKTRIQLDICREEQYELLLKHYAEQIRDCKYKKEIKLIKAEIKHVEHERETEYRSIISNAHGIKQLCTEIDRFNQEYGTKIYPRECPIFFDDYCNAPDPIAPDIQRYAFRFQL